VDENLASDQQNALVQEIVNSVASSVVVLPLFIVGILIIRKIVKEDIIKKINMSDKR
jgi:hypothetical protein